MEPVVVIGELLNSAKGTASDLPSMQSVGEGADPHRMQWLTRQMASIVAQLEAMLADIEAGCSVTDLGFYAMEEFEEMVEAARMEIASLQRMIKSLELAR